MTQKSLESLIEQLKNSGDAQFAESKPGAINAFEKKYETKLPKEVKTFYEQLNGLTVFDRAYRFVGLESVRPAGQVVHNNLKRLPETWYAFCYIGESWLGFDASQKDAVVIDLDPYATEYSVIAFSLSDFFSKLLDSQEKPLFWLFKPTLCDGRAEVRISSDVLRKKHATLWEDLTKESKQNASASEHETPDVLATKIQKFERIARCECPFEIDEEWDTSYKYIKINRE